MSKHVRVALMSISAAGALITVLAACGSNASGSDSSSGGLTGTIKIDAPLSLSGPAGFAGVPEKQGMQFAINQINSSKYLGSAKLKANFVDVGTANDQATIAVRGMVNDGSAAIMGFTASNQALAVAPITEQAKIPLIVVNSGGLNNLTQVGDYIYQTDTANYAGLEKTAEVLKEKGVPSTAIIYNNDVPALVYQLSVYRADLAKLGIRVSDVVPVMSTATDFSAQVTSVLSTHPKAIGVLARGSQDLTIVVQLKHAGYKGEVWGQSPLGAGAAASAAPLTNGVFFAMDAAAGSDQPTMQAFFKSYQAKTGHVANTWTAQGYDSVYVLARALKAANCSSRACVQKGLQTVMRTGYSGALGKVTFVNRNAKAPGVVIEIENGKEVVIK